MRISELRIRNFRSFDDMTLDFGNLTAICGHNSSGKSNIFEAIQLAFKREISREDIYENTLSAIRDTPGAPLLSIWIDMTFENCPREIARLAEQPTATTVVYSFRAVRSGTITRKLGSKTLEPMDLDELTKHFNIVYVPPIRDLLKGGMKPFKDLFAETLKRTRRGRDIKELTNTAQQFLQEKANVMLSGHSDVVHGIFNADHLEANTQNISLDSLYDDITLLVNINNENIPLEKLGTGHQSAVILHLFREYGEELEGKTLFLFEEPDNHLHPSTIRTICTDLEKIAEQSQVLITTHSPILLNHFGFHKTVSLFTDENRLSRKRKIDLSGYSENQIISLLLRYGLRATEPLLTKRIIVTEGKIDVTILSQLIELKYNKTPDHMEIAIVQAGGKPGVVELCQLLNRLDADWVAVFDWDASESNDVPHIKDISIEQINDAKESVLKIMPIIDNTRRRGNRVYRSLEDIHSELEFGRPVPKIYDDSYLREVVLISNRLSRDERSQLKQALRYGHKTTYRELLSKAKICLWSGTIEENLIGASGAVELVERLFIKRGMLNGPIASTSERKNRIKNLLKKTANDADGIREILEGLSNNGKLSRNEFKYALELFTRDLL